MYFIIRIRKSALTINSVWCRDNMRGLGPCVEGLIPSIETIYFGIAPDYINIYMNTNLCKFCSKECKSPNSLRNHERLCKSNPNKQESNLKNRINTIPWNKGLTKETDDRVKKNAEGVKESMKTLFDSGYRTPAQNEYWTEERRKQRSDWRKQLHKDFPETHPNRRLAGNRSKMTYPEKVALI